jgi:serine/threonine protein kinase
VQQLLEELLESGRTPDEVCRACPALLPEVRRRWQQLRTLDAQFGALFPPLGSTSPDAGAAVGTPSYMAPEQPRGQRRVILLYDAWGRPKGAARWRGELEALEKPGQQVLLSRSPKAQAPQIR